MGHSALYKGHKIQWAPRRESNPELPAKPWKTVPNTKGISEEKCVEMLATLEEQYPEHLFRGWLT